VSISEVFLGTVTESISGMVQKVQGFLGNDKSGNGSSSFNSNIGYSAPDASNGHSPNTSNLSNLEAEELLDSKGKKKRPAMSPHHQFMYAMMVISAMVMHLDVNLAAPNLSNIAHDFKLTPAQRDWRIGGLVQFSFFLVGGTSSLMIGPLADSMNRSILLVGLLVLSSFSNLVVGLFMPYGGAGFFYYFICRSLIGICEDNELNLNLNTNS
jgi:hypothetical protein